MKQRTQIEGFWEDAQGNMTPEAKVKDIDKLRDDVVRELFAQAEATHQALAAFKAHALEDVAAFVSTSATQYEAEIGGTKGNVTLYTYDGRYKLQRAMQETIAFDEGLQAAKALIDECITVWAVGSNDNIRVLVNHAFQVDKEGNVSTGRILSLRRIDIKDAKWLNAMRAIGDSMKSVSSKAYIRFYVRNDATGEYLPLALNIAAV
jgi:Protein of unknown function (DUF3164)